MGSWLSPQNYMGLVPREHEMAAKKRAESMAEMLDQGPPDLDAAIAEAVALETSGGDAPPADPPPAVAAAEPEAKPDPAPDPKPENPDAAEPNPPKLNLQLGEEEPDHEPDTEPEWLKGQPEDVQKYVRDLRSARDGQRHAYARRKDQVETLQRRLDQAEIERRQAIHIALEQRKGQPAAGAAPAGEQPGKPAAPAKARIPVQVDPDTGEATVDPESITPMIEARARAIVAEQYGQQTAAAARESSVERIVSEAGITTETQAALVSAYQDAQQLLGEAQRVSGVQVKSIAEAKSLLHRYQAEGILQRKYPGITLNDVFDVYQGSADPDGYGHNLVRIAKSYQDRWFGEKPAPNGANGHGANGNGRPAPSRAPRPIGDHPASMASRASGVNARTGQARSTLDEIADINSVDKALSMSGKEVDDLMRRWESEMGEKPTGFLR